MKKVKLFEKGYKEFKRLNFKENELRFKKLVKEGQNPKALFIGCSDSRVMPSMITGSKPGELFIIRNIGNFVPPFSPDNDFHATAAAIEYAVSDLNISDIIVCGHSDCGAIKACFKEHKATQNNIHTVKWLQLGKPAIKSAQEFLSGEPLEAQRAFAEKVSVIYQLENLLTYPLLCERVEEKTLYLHGWYYNISDGSIEYFDDEAMEFKPLGED